MRSALAATLLTGLSLLGGCRTPAPRPGDSLPRLGDEIIVAGQLFHTTTPVVTWLDAGGYDAYRPHRRDRPDEVLPGRPAAGCDTPSRLSLERRLVPEAAELAGERKPGTPIDLATLREQVTQFVIHYDVAYTSANCFHILHDVRGLSVHFLLDLDGSLYQTADLRDRARHAGSANNRSIGIEIAHPGPLTGQEGLAERYHRDEAGSVLEVPSWVPRGALADDFVCRPARPDPVTAAINGRELVQYDFTEAQYQALAHLVAALSRALPRVRLDVPREQDGSMAMRTLSPEELASFEGILGHYHVTARKQDPGPAFHWERVLRDARALVPTAAEPR